MGAYPKGVCGIETKIKMNKMDHAKTYVQASNDHDLNRIEAMFAPSANYVSAGAGTHIGRTGIRAMMDGFFSTHSDLNWQTARWHEDVDGACAFDFVMTAKNMHTGEKIKRAGHERIWVDENGFITRIEVHL